MTITPLDDRVVRASFQRAAPTYDQHAVLQHEVEQRLLERLEFFSLQPQVVLDMGCGPGNGSRVLAQRYPQAQVLGLDWAQAMLAQPGFEQAPQVSRLCADMRRLPLAARSVDLLFSSLALQWASDLPALFSEVRRVLRPGGLLLFSTFGPDTLYELRQAWSQVDQLPHVNRHIDMHHVGDALVAAGFRDPVMDTQRIVLHYREVLTLMHDLKAIGAHNAALERPTGLTGRGVLQKVLAGYDAFQQDGIYPATYEVIIGAARGPAEGQPMRDAQGEVATFSIDALRNSRRGS
jgi:malonyl-CoA O-methyltransferase